MRVFWASLGCFVRLNNPGSFSFLTISSPWREPPHALSPWPIRRVPPVAVAVHVAVRGHPPALVQVVDLVLLFFLSGGTADVALFGNHFPVRVLKNKPLTYFYYDYLWSFHLARTLFYPLSLFPLFRTSRNLKLLLVRIFWRYLKPPSPLSSYVLNGSPYHGNYCIICLIKRFITNA